MDRVGPDVKAIFTEVLRLPEGAERAAYLNRACGGDDGLRRRVEALLAAHARADDVLGPTDTSTTEDAAPAGAGHDATGAIEPTDPGQTIGHTGPPGGHDVTTSPGGGNGDALSRGDVVRYSLRSYEQGLVIFQRLADTNPEVVRFQHDLAISHNLIGGLHRETNQPKEGLQSFECARAIQQKLADANPSITEFKSDLGATLNNMAMIEMGHGRWGEARSRLIDAVRYQRVALRAYPRNSLYRHLLSLDLSNLSRTSLALRTPAEAAESARELVALNPGGPETLYNGSRFLARCTPLAAKPSDASRYADEALTLLKQAVTAGWNDAARTATDPDLAPLRGREDFKLMLMDLSFPAEPFARTE